MKKFIAIVSVILIVGLIAILGVQLVKSANVESIEIVGDIQTIYFVESTSDVNFNDADLKITYKDGSVKIKKLTKKLISVKNFNTSVVNNGTMKITYKSTTIDVGYAVVWTGLYYLNSEKVEVYNGTSISTVNLGPYIAGVNNMNQDKTTSTEMIYFGANGVCNYYLRSSTTSSWYMDDGEFDKSYYYQIVGNAINVHLGDRGVYKMYAIFSKDGELSLTTVEREFVTETSEFLRTRSERSFSHYEMKGNRTISEGSITVVEKNGRQIEFKKNSKFSDSDLNIYLKVNFANDSFLKTVYVRFNESMFVSDKEFSTVVVTPSSLSATCFYGGVRFELEYKVVS